MRKLRDILFYAFLIIPAVGIVIGVQYATKNKHSAHTSKVTTVTSDETGHREIARAGKSAGHVAGHSEEMPKASGTTKSTASKASKKSVEAHTSGADVAAEHVAPLAAMIPAEHGAEKDTAALNGVCRSVEFEGDAPQRITVGKKDWDVVMDAFHDVKDDYLKWLEQHKTALSTEQMSQLAARVKFTRIQRPPSADELDLSWRGVATWSLDGSNEPLIKIGGGFLELAHRDKKRAKFELARMVAQAWSPCELKRLGVGEMWAGLTSCLKVEGADACTSGSYSEAAWAVGSALAVQVSEPGCKVPAFATAEYGQCVASVVPFKNGEGPVSTPVEKAATTVHSVREPAAVWKEARQ